jgi:hypothetical protein
MPMRTILYRPISIGGAAFSRGPPPFFLKFHFKNAEITYMTDKEKTYISLNKYFLALQHKLTRYKMAGLYPPEYLLKSFEDTKRRLRIFSKAFKK